MVSDQTSQDHRGPDNQIDIRPRLLRERPKDRVVGGALETGILHVGDDTDQRHLRIARLAVPEDRQRQRTAERFAIAEEMACRRGAHDHHRRVRLIVCIGEKPSFQESDTECRKVSRRCRYRRGLIGDAAISSQRQDDPAFRRRKNGADAGGGHSGQCPISSSTRLTTAICAAPLRSRFIESPSDAVDHVFDLDAKIGMEQANQAAAEEQCADEEYDRDGELADRQRSADPRSAHTLRCAGAADPQRFCPGRLQRRYEAGQDRDQEQPSANVKRSVGMST